MSGVALKVETSRWLSSGKLVAPKEDNIHSSNEDHIQENFEIFDFELTDEEMQEMTALDWNERFAAY